MVKLDFGGMAGYLALFYETVFDIGIGSGAEYAESTSVKRMGLEARPRWESMSPVRSVEINIRWSSGKRE